MSLLREQRSVLEELVEFVDRLTVKGLGSDKIIREIIKSFKLSHRQILDGKTSSTAEVNLGFRTYSELIVCIDNFENIVNIYLNNDGDIEEFYKKAI